MAVNMRHRFPYKMNKYRDKSDTIGEKRSILLGRKMATEKVSFVLRPVSRADRKLGLPVSLRSSFAFWPRIA